MNPVSKLEQLAAWQQEAKQGEARKRLDALFDDGSFVELDAFGGAGVVTGYGMVNQALVYAYAQEPAAEGGALTAVNARKVRRLYELAAKTGAPLVAVLDSKGAAIGEGAEMLTAYSDLLLGANNLSGVVPQIAWVAGTCAGAFAMLAAGCDVVVMEKEGEFFLNPPFNTAQTEDKQEAGTADFAAKAGLVSLVAEDQAQAAQLVKQLLGYLPQNNLSLPPVYEGKPVADAAAAQKVMEDCPGGDLKSLINALADGNTALELYGAYGENSAVALALMGGMPVGLAAACGELHTSDCNKLARFMQLCDAYSLPVITLLDTPGFTVTSCPGLVKAASRLANTYAEATTVKMTLLAGQAIGAAYLALASRNAGADLVYAWPTAVISALPVQTAVEFTLHNRLRQVDDPAAVRAQLAEEYKDTVASPMEAAKAGLLDGILAPADTRNTLIHGLEALADKRMNRLSKKHSNTVL